MARARRPASASKVNASGAGTAKSTKSGTTAGSRSRSEFVCPECGRTFARAAALGAHRSRVHGVAGQSAQAKRSRSRRQQAVKSTRAATTRPAAANGTARRAASQAGRRRPSRATATHQDGINRDALLKTLFPSGMPAREEVIHAVGGWLDEAERLARMR